MNRGEQAGPFTTSMATVVDEGGQATIGVPVGPWQQVGEIKKGGSIKVDGTTYILRDVQDNGGNFMYAQFYSQQRNPVEDEIVALSAVGLDGTEIDTNYVPMITGKNYGVPQPNFQGMAANSVKLFHVWKRKIQWVTFTGFAAEPTTPPKDQVTPAEVTAAVGAQQNQQQQIQNQTIVQQFAALKDKRKEWDAIPADPKTPKGALRALFQSAAKGDLTAVRVRMKSSQAGSDPMLDITARFITANQFARATAIARFGEDKVQTLQVVSVNGNQMPGLMDMEMGILSLTWQPRPDGGLTSNQVAVIKGDDGTYYLDTSPATESVNGVQQSQATATTMLLSMAQRMEQINQLLKDNPSLTIDQFRHALSNPAAPATQPATTHPS
jgi:alpha-ketoglutarate-dependent taurine dioxygenase